MPIVGVKRDQLFEALGRTYSEWARSSAHVLVGFAAAVAVPGGPPRSRQQPAVSAAALLKHLLRQHNLQHSTC